MKRIALITLFVLLGIFVNSSFAVELTVFAPKMYERGKGEPFTETDNFTVAGLTGTGQLILHNGGSDKKTRVSSAEIWFNGALVFDPSDFNKNVEHLAADVTLTEVNEISVKLNGKPGSYLTAEVKKNVEADAASVCGSGECEIEGAGAKIVVPPDALDSNTLITMKEVALPKPLPNGSILASKFIDFGPDGTVFNKPVTITLPYNDVDNDGLIDGTDLFEGRATVFYYEESEGEWKEISAGIFHTEKNLLSFRINHFSGSTVGTSDEEVPVVPDPDGHFKIPHLWPGQNPPPEVSTYPPSDRAK